MSERSLAAVTTVKDAHPRVEWMLDHGYRLERIQGEIDGFDGLDPEEQSALWVWAWTATDMGASTRLRRMAGLTAADVPNG